MPDVCWRVLALWASQHRLGLSEKAVGKVATSVVYSCGPTLALTEDTITPVRGWFPACLIPMENKVLLG
jgi:hypothetical protein